MLKVVNVMTGTWPTGAVTVQIHCWFFRYTGKFGFVSILLLVPGRAWECKVGLERKLQKEVEHIRVKVGGILYQR